MKIIKIRSIVSICAAIIIFDTRAMGNSIVAHGNFWSKAQQTSANTMTVMLPTDKTPWNPDEMGPFFTIMLGRHAETDESSLGFSHGSLSEGKVTVETVDIHNTIQFLMLGLCLKINEIFSSPRERAIITALMLKPISNVARNGQPLSCIWDLCFDEQKLGVLAGKRDEEILHNPEFIEMLADKSYAIEGGESGEQVINRVKIGIWKIWEFLEAADRTDGALVYVVTHRATLNWILRFLTGNYELSPVLVSPYDTLVCQFFPEANAVRLYGEGFYTPAGILCDSGIVSKYGRSREDVSYVIDLATQEARQKKQEMMKVRSTESLW